MASWSLTMFADALTAKCTSGLQIISGLGVILTCSDREAQNYGIFLRELFVSMNRWQVAACPIPKNGLNPLKS